MPQPSPAVVLDDEASTILPQWPGRPMSPRPPYHDLRRLVKPENPSIGGGHHERSWAMTRTSSSATSTASRSPSPGTTSESSQNYADSTSSWATSQVARSATDCGLPNDDEPLAEPFGRPGEDELFRRLPRRPTTPVSRFARSVRDIAARSPSRPSSLRNAMSVRESPEHQVISPEHLETDMSESEEETAGESDTDTDDDNDWSGQNGNLESLLIEAVEGDLALAASLVPVVHHEFQLALKSKVESWQCTTTGHGSTDSSPRGNPPKGESSRDQDGGNSRKRRRRSSSDEGEREVPNGGDGDEGDEDEERDGDLGQTPPDGTDSTPTLACPFHKRDPVKYGIQPGNSAGAKKHKYRGCIGPGYRSIQRLKEHLKRVHSPVQCDRCYEIFPGSLKERAACLAKLAEHRQMAVPCERGDASKKEGIDEFQWAILDKQSRKKNQEAHRVEKWYEIWNVLFPAPGVEKPESPWNDIVVQHPYKQSSTYAEESFAKLFLRIVEHKVQQKEIDPDTYESIREHLRSAAKMTLRAHMSLYGVPSTQTSSSESKKLSLGSSAKLSAPATTGSHQMSATTAATSVTAGAPAMGRAVANPTPNNYTLNPSYHSMDMPMARQHSQQQHSPRQFAHMSPIPQAGFGHPQVGGGNMAGFASMASTDELYAFNYMFTPSAPHPQGHHTASWPGANSVPFAAPHGMPQSFTGLPGTEYYADVGDYSQTGQDEV